MRARLRLLILALAVAACSTGGESATTAPPTTGVTPPTTAPPVSTTPAPSTVPDTATPGPVPECRAGETPFTADGLVATLGEGDGDATVIGGVRWAPEDGCERVVIDLLTSDGAPAGDLGEATVSFRADAGVVRVELPLRVTGVSDIRIEGDLVGRIFVVRTATGQLAVDVHLATDEPVAVRSFEEGEPSRVVVDVASDPAGPGRSVPPTITDNVVVLSPAPGPAEYPLAVSGYARTFEANVLARLVQEGAIAEDSFTTATDWLEAWGEFTISFTGGPAGEATLLVGEESARDGRFEGAAVRLDMS